MHVTCHFTPLLFDVFHITSITCYFTSNHSLHSLSSLSCVLLNCFHFTSLTSFLQSHEVAIKCLSNRAACYKQLSNFEGTISDSTEVLQYRPDDIKVRRGMA